jgi:four helix bundle protein
VGNESESGEVQVKTDAPNQAPSKTKTITHGLHGFTAYAKAVELFDLVVLDLQPLHGKYELTRLVAQQLASADSIASNIEEGYGRGSKKDYSHFLIIARGSAQETLGRYERLKHWLDPQAIANRVALCGEIIAILTASIRKLRTT